MYTHDAPRGSLLGVFSTMARQYLPVPDPSVRLDRFSVAAQIVLATLLCAPALFNLGVAIPGRPGLADLPGTVNYHWLVQTMGLSGASGSSMLMYPTTVDRIVIDGFPLDALVSSPFTAVLGWPAGFSIFVWLSFCALGLAHAWMAKTWWKSEYAALIGGVVAQCSPFLIREVVDGRPTQLFGAIFLPLALTFLLRGVMLDRHRSSAIAGVMIGLGALSYWYYGVFFALAAAAVLVLAGLSGRSIARSLGALVVGAVAVTAVPAVYTLQAVSVMPGIETRWSDQVLHGSEWISLLQILEFRDLGTAVSLERVIALQVVVAACVLMSWWRAPRTTWLAPSVLGVMALLFAAGPSISLPGLPPIPGPFHLFRVSDVMSRLWWPDRALVVLVPAVSLLAAGGVLQFVRAVSLGSRERLAVLAIAGGIAAEAFVVIPGLPMPTSWGAETEASAALSRGEGPVLIVPMGHGESEPDMRMLIDQVHHGRPLVNGPMVPGSSAAPQAFRDFAAAPAVQALLACENDAAQGVTSEAWAQLIEYGIVTVVLDPGRAAGLRSGADRFENCIRRLMGPPTGSEGPYRLYAVPGT